MEAIVCATDPGSPEATNSETEAWKTASAEWNLWTSGTDRRCPNPGTIRRASHDI
jgi:hypothetical protein